MATNDPTGGPAFPTPAGHATVEDWHPGHGEVRRTVEVCRTGMSLRDWFAGQALIGMLSADPHLVKQGIEAGSFPGASHPSDFATCAYDMADAMLAARQQNGEAGHG